MLAAAQRGAHVTAIDLSQKLVELARERIGGDVGAGSIDFRVGDLFDPALGRFDHVVGMDSLIHYKAADVVRVLSGLAARTDRSMLFPFAPSSAFLQAFLAVGRLVPRGDRSPAIVPVAERTLRRLIAAEPAMAGWTSARTHRVARGFYTSQALEVLRAAVLVGVLVQQLLQQQVLLPQVGAGQLALQWAGRTSAHATSLPALP